MGWSNGGAYRSATAMFELGQYMAHALPAADWRVVQPLFESANSGGGPFAVSPADTRRMAEVFRAAAKHRLVPRFWRKSASELAAVAAKYAASGTPWRWS